MLIGLESRTEAVVGFAAAEALPDYVYKTKDSFKSSPDCTHGLSIHRTNAGEKADRANENKAY